MTTMLAILVLGQVGGVDLRNQGVTAGRARFLDCSGAGISCYVDGGVGYLGVTGGGSSSDGGGAPVSVQYWVGAADSTLTAEKNLGALGTGLVVNTGGVPSAYVGASCTNQFPRSLSASGAATCASVSLSTDVTGTLANSSLASTYSGVGVCGANTFASTLNGNAGPTCTQPSYSGLSGTVPAYATIQNESSGLAQRSTVNFIGAGVNCVDNGGSSRTDCTVLGSQDYDFIDAGVLKLNAASGATALEINAGARIGIAGCSACKLYNDGSNWVMTSPLVMSGVNLSVNDSISVNAAGPFSFIDGRPANAIGANFNFQTLNSHTNDERLASFNNNSNIVASITRMGNASLNCPSGFSSNCGTWQDGTGVSGHVFAQSSSGLYLTVAGRLAENHAAIETDGGKPVYDGGTWVLQEPDGGTYYAYAGLHGEVTLTNTEARDAGGWLAEFKNKINESSTDTRAFIDYNGGFGQRHALTQAQFGGDAVLVNTSLGQFYYGQLESALMYDFVAHRWNWKKASGWARIPDILDVYSSIQDEGSALTQRATLNFTGAGVTCVDNAGATRTDCTITGGGGGSANTVAVTLDFGAGDTTTSVAVTGQAWVTTSSIIVCAPTMVATTDRAEGAEDAIIEGLTVAVSNRVAATGFTLKAAPAQGQAKGKYVFHCTGA